jgi:type II secretory ATPase GspE/PulE/Tfp pilus assembly ATPase PilB-like protein
VGEKSIRFDFGRWLLIVLGALALWSMLGDVSWAAERNPGGLTEQSPFIRGPGFYVSIIKLCLFLPVFWCWAATTSWVNEDTQRIKWSAAQWNAVMVGSGLGGILLFFLIPTFWAGYPILLLAYAIPLGIYIGKRNKEVGEHEQVLTREHLEFVMKNGLRGLGVKTKKRPVQAGVTYKPTLHKENKDNQTLILAAKRLPGLAEPELIFKKSQDLILDAMVNQGTALQAEDILLEITPQGATTRYRINGVWESAPHMDFETAKGIVGVYLQLGGKEPSDLRNPQTSKFNVEVGNKKLKGTFTFQPVRGGARALLNLDAGGKKLETLQQLGMGDALLEHITKTIRVKQGVLIASAPAGGGFTSVFNATGLLLDRYNRSYAELVDTTLSDPHVDNVEVFTYNSAAGESPASILPKVMRQYPEGYISRRLLEADSLKELLELATDEKIVYLGANAKEACEAPLRLLILKNAAGGRVPPMELAKSLIGVVNMRMVRKLCPTCKVEYEPDPALLQRLGLKPAPNKKFYRLYVPNPEKKEKPCTACNSRGFVGRTGMFEFLAMNDRLRQALAQGVALDVFRNEAAKNGLYRLQQDAIRLVDLGITSLEEVQRALKEG